jgi:hypothetical protein
VLSWRHGSSGRALASQAQGPEFNPHYYQKKGKNYSVNVNSLIRKKYQCIVIK